jgi:hypothetical protein
VIIFPSISPLSSVPSTPPASPSPLSPLAGKLKLGCAGFVVEYRERSASLASVRFCFRRCVKPFVPSLQEISTKSGLLIWNLWSVVVVVFAWAYITKKTCSFIWGSNLRRICVW